MCLRQLGVEIGQQEMCCKVGPLSPCTLEGETAPCAITSLPSVPAHPKGLSALAVLSLLTS